MGAGWRGLLACKCCLSAPFKSMVAVKTSDAMAPCPFSPPSPPCPICGQPTTTCVTRTSNRNGNAGRPYLKCGSCRKFITFVDKRGISSKNPECVCGKASRIQVAGKGKGRGLHYVCQSGACDFFDVARNKDGDQISLTEKLVEDLARILI
ncbi:uncharacterized protein MYCFIDRAFT_77627 [Pseudocercospora fijiensis CIRAD86]|uniref:GRF-like zinc ribbon domain-containing protein n=1 Tax=Pseudocercospora fijiensis (strain CIRAD86) TaxID=383855 RepID=M3AX73_PSEFD|nr:uncharacterized protein MYCFIDRAFT_77627 [Pseudocercospora fijiensis CIRAD86]EME82072.1 hypothetical protein MYCFIDRAFT_77627 [Pseudocercospora fijiensis CIRAD86]